MTYPVKCQQVKRGTSRFLLVMLLLAIYAAGNLEIASLHSLLHDSSGDSVTHTGKDENDACHQSIYHNLKSEDCSHKSHITALKKCPLCQLAIQTLHLAGRPAEEIMVSRAVVVAATHPGTIHACSLLPLPARAPPVS